MEGQSEAKMFAFDRSKISIQQMMKCKEKFTIKTFLTLMPSLEVQAGFPSIPKNEITAVNMFV